MNRVTFVIWYLNLLCLAKVVIDWLMFRRLVRRTDRMLGRAAERDKAAVSPAP